MKQIKNNESKNKVVFALIILIRKNEECPSIRRRQGNYEKIYFCIPSLELSK